MINFDLIENNLIPRNKEIFNSFTICDKHLGDIYYKYGDLKKVIVSISGGSDSDVLLDLIYQVCEINNYNISDITFIMSDTGCEYEATRKHLKDLEEFYGINIKISRPLKPIPIVCRDYGQPFLSKQVSEFMERLQRHGFKWEDRPFDELLKEYPACKSALQWWCNEKGEGSQFGINRNKWLKEFIIENPPTFKISNKCCSYAKKKPIRKIIKNGGYVLHVMGVRKSEGGVRATAYKNCYTDGTEKGDISNYRPIFWYKDIDKEIYESHFYITHSECYTKYGLKRTGCAGCPFGRNFNEELEVIKKYEPKLYRWVTTVYKESYEYTNKYREFCKLKNKEFKKDNNIDQCSIF